MQPATHALFDLDGLLLNTESIYTEVTQEIVGRFGKQYDWNLKRNMIGRPAIDSAQFLISQLKIPISVQEYLDERNEKLRAKFATCAAMPGAEKLIRHLHKNKIPIAVASSSSRDLLNIKISRHPWFDLFNAIISGDQIPAGRGKPNPDIFIKAANQIGVATESTPALQSVLVFEDAPAGLQAGLAAKMRVIAVPDKHMEKERYRGAELILNSLNEFKPDSFGLPSY